MYPDGYNDTKITIFGPIMKRNQKLSDIFGGLAVFAVFAGCVEAPDGGFTSWTLICLAAAFCFGVLSKKTQAAE